MFRAGISEETLLNIPCIKGLTPEILLLKRKGTVSRDFSLCDGILPTHVRGQVGVGVCVRVLAHVLVSVLAHVHLHLCQFEYEYLCSTW